MIRRLLSPACVTNWIYANKYDELVNVGKGKLILSPTVQDINDVTLRMHQHLFDSHIILCEDYIHTANLLHSLYNKLSFIEEPPLNTALVMSEAHTKQTLSEELIQLSDHLKHNEEMYSMRKEALNAQEMVRQQQQIRKYNQTQLYKQQLLDFRTHTGYGHIINLDQEKPDLIGYLNQGLNVYYLYPEGGRHISWFLGIAEQARYPYEILPGPSEVLATLALTGFPADRFGIEYYVSDISRGKVLEILLTRKKQCFSVCFYEELCSLQYLLTQVEKVYGSHQLVFVRVQSQEECLRRQVGSALEFIRGRPLPSPQDKSLKCVVVVSPYAIEYNSEFKEAEFQKHYLNELVFSNDTTLYEVEKLTTKLESLQSPRSYEIDSIKAAKYLKEIISDQEDALLVLQSLLRVSKFEAKRMMSEAKCLPNDVLQIENWPATGL